MASSSSVAVPEKEDVESDLEIWHLSAGVLVKIPPVNSQVYYFVQGHAEHASATGSTIDLEMIKNTPHKILCRVQAVKYYADAQTDEVYTRIALKPLDPNEPTEIDNEAEDNADRVYSLRKASRSDIIDKRFSLTKHFNDIIPYGVSFPCVDVHGKSWNFRRSCHHLVKGWSGFMREKDLKKDDTILFMKGTDETVRVGIRRAKPSAKKYASADLVVEAAELAATGNAFEVCYYPRVGTPEFVVNAARVNAASNQIYRDDTRAFIYNMKVEYEESERHYRVTEVAVLSAEEADDPKHWPDSPWKLLQIREVLTTQDMRVSPWTVKKKLPEDYFVVNPSNNVPWGS